MDHYSSYCSLSVLIKVFLLGISTKANAVTAWIPITWFPVSRRRHWLILLGFRRHLTHWWSCRPFSESKQRQKPLICSVWFGQIFFARKRGVEHLFDPILRWSCRLQMCFGDRSSVFRERE